MIQAIILAAGNSTRTYPLTLTKPKPLLKIANKTILEHTLEQLDGLVDEVIIVLCYRKEQIIDFLKNLKNFGFSIKFVEQKKPLGTGHAVLQAKNLIKDRFLVINGDDIFFRKDIEACLKHTYCMLAQKVKEPQRFGILVTKNNLVKSIIEKPKNPPSDLANTGLYVFDKKVLPIIENLKKSERGEYEIVDVIAELAKNNEVKYVATDSWIPIGYPWDLLAANECFLTKIKAKVEGDIEPNATIKGNVVIGKGSIIKNNSYIEGPVIIGENCIIGPNCYIRPCTTIGNNCKMGNGVEIKNSVIGDNVKISHLSYFPDSVFGDNINIGAGSISADLRHDETNVKTPVNGKIIDTGRRKLGAIIGDNVKLGIHTSIYPGRKIWPNKTTYPGEVVTKDIM